MAVTILERPEGHVLDTTAQTATASSSYGAGDAQFVSPTVHGLVDGDFIYAESDIENYAGFWYVDALTTGIFKIKRYAAGDYVQFISDGSITWYKSNTNHGWSAVHLPITYRLSTNIYPTNSSDTVRTVSSTQDANGYTVLLISGSLGSGVNTYDFVDLVAPNDTDLSGPYQILEFISPTVLLINLAYDSTNNFTSATVQKRYNNYNFVVRVYVGINAGHAWAAIKPYELAATMLFIPDENNEAFFSVNEIVKSYIETRNNLTLGTLPNNTDFWANFYIEVAESYDDSDGYTFGTLTSSFTSDQATFEGTGVNADMEFKNLYSGYLSEYLMTNSAAKFLTLFAIPVIFSCGDGTPNCYQDISFLLPTNDQAILVKDYYNGDTFLIRETIFVADTGPGVFRQELTVLDCADSLSAGSNNFGNGQWNGNDPGEDWTLGQSATVVLGAGQTSDLLIGDAVITVLDGQTYELTITINLLNSNAVTLIVAVSDENNVFEQEVINQNFTVSGTYTFTFLAASASGSYPDMRVTASSVAGNTLSIGAINVSNVIPTGLSPDRVDIFLTEEDGTPISETKTFAIECGCANNEIRLTWLNNLGGFDYWSFIAKKDDIVEIRESGTATKNIFPTWPQSYGAQADTVRKQTFRDSNKAYTVRSQHLTEDQLNAISYIKSSVVVQIINSRTDRRTVLVDTESFVKFKDGDKTHEIAFNISFTDDIPSQTV